MFAFVPASGTLLQDFVVTLLFYQVIGKFEPVSWMSFRASR